MKIKGLPVRKIPNPKKQYILIRMKNGKPNGYFPRLYSRKGDADRNARNTNKDEKDGTEWVVFER